jgi:hypothetical protein
VRISRTLTLFICLAMLASQSAWAHSPRVRVGFVFGPMWGPFWYPQPWPPYPPPVVVAPPAPPVYVEQRAPAETTEAVWYYCRSAGAYYPAVGTCAERWLPVLPEPEK